MRYSSVIGSSFSVRNSRFWSKNLENEEFI